jgi:hypothetical protein
MRERLAIRLTEGREELFVVFRPERVVSEIRQALGLVG